MERKTGHRGSEHPGGAELHLHRDEVIVCSGRWGQCWVGACGVGVWRAGRVVSVRKTEKEGVAGGKPHHKQRLHCVTHNFIGFRGTYLSVCASH